MKRILLFTLLICFAACDTQGSSESLAGQQSPVVSRDSLQSFSEDDPEIIASRILEDSRFKMLTQETWVLVKSRKPKREFESLINSERHIIMINDIFKDNGVNRGNGVAVRNVILRRLTERASLPPGVDPAQCAAIFQAKNTLIYAEYMFDLQSCQPSWWEFWDAMWAANVCIPAAQLKASAAYELASLEYFACLDGDT